MDAKDLMIDDWVEVTRTECVADGGHYITWSEYGKVVGITDSYIEVEVRDGEYNVDAHEDELKPIPLTPEILEKNGFELKGDGWLWCEDKDVEEQNYSFVQFRRDGEVRVVEINHLNKAVTKFRNIQNVHELQHALKLCGIDKEIEL